MPAAGPEEVRSALADHGYLADEGLATSVFLAMALRRPLLLEGEAGVGKTEVAKALSRWTGGELVRLQCYEGIDVSQAVYEWDYSRQLLHIRAAEARAGAWAGDPGGARDGAGGGGGRGVGPEVEDELYSERFLVRRPLLAAIAPPPSPPPSPRPPPVLLIDEVDRADDEFEAFLLEILSDYAVTVPELGTFRAV
ncbi:MAG: AAA family ATPase, partial [Acidimicrobiales bacterium]